MYRLLSPLKALVPVVGFFSLWGLFSWRFHFPNPNVLPPPQEFLLVLAHPADFNPEINGGRLGLLLLILRSLLRVSLGIGLAFFVGVPIGILSASRWLGAIFNPLLIFFAPVSPVVWIGFAMVMLPGGESLPVFLVFISIVFFVALSASAAVSRIDPALLNLARSFGVNRFQEFVYVVLPSILPDVFVSLRWNVLAALVALLIAEGVVIESGHFGIGSLVMFARQSDNAALGLACVVLVALLGLFLDQGIGLVQKRILRWKDV